MGRKNNRIPVQRKNYKSYNEKIAEYETLKQDVVAQLRQRPPEEIDRALADLRRRLGV
jgi:hypothetical protein